MNLAFAGMNAGAVILCRLCNPPSKMGFSLNLKSSLNLVFFICWKEIKV
jgi:hypothetical protein